MTEPEPLFETLGLVAPTGTSAVLNELLFLVILGIDSLHTGVGTTLPSGIEAQQPADIDTQEPSPAPGP